MTSNTDKKLSAHRTSIARETATDELATRRYPTTKGCWNYSLTGRAALAGQPVVALMGALTLALSVTAAAASASGYSSSVPTNHNPYVPSYTGTAARPYSSLNDSSWGASAGSTASSSWRESPQLNDTPMLNSAPVVHRPMVQSQPSSSTYSAGSTYERPHQWDAEQSMARESVFPSHHSILPDTSSSRNSGSSLYRHKISPYYW